jgi:hypothetical protein
MACNAVARAPSQCLSARVMERHNHQKYVAMANFSFSSLNQNQNQNLFQSNTSPSPTFLNDACPSVSPTIFLNDASSSDEEEEQRLFTQPEAEAEAIDLMAANTKKSDPPKRKATPPCKNPNKNKKRCDISDAYLDAQLKQVSTKNANDSLLRADDSLLHAATEDNESKRVTKYLFMPVLGKKSSVWWEGFAQFMPSKHPKLFTEYAVCLACSKSSNPDLGLAKIIFELTRSSTIPRSTRSYSTIGPHNIHQEYARIRRQA